MASINGITIKNLKSYRGHEWETCAQGDLWNGKTKLGFWSQDSWGGPNEYETQACHDTVSAAAKKFQKGFKKNDFKDPIGYEILGDTDSFMDYVLFVKDMEKLYKRNKMASGVVLISMYKGNIYPLPLTAYVRDKEILQQRGKPVYDRIVKMLGSEDFTMYCVASPHDLDFLVDEKHPAPEFLKYVY